MGMWPLTFPGSQMKYIYHGKLISYCSNYNQSQVSVIDLSQTFSLQSLWVSRGLDLGLYGDTTKLLTSCLKQQLPLIFHLCMSILQPL